MQLDQHEEQKDLLLQVSMSGLVVCLRCFWCATDFSDVLQVFVLDTYVWRRVRFLKEKVNLDLLCNQIVRTNEAEPSIVIVKQLML